MKSTSLFTAPQDLRCNATLKDPKLLRAEGVKASFKPGTTSTPTASTLAEDVRMPRKPIWGLTLLLTMPAAFAQSDTSDVVVAKALLGEVRQLR
jgi:hypothetical protein